MFKLLANKLELIVELFINIMLYFLARTAPARVPDNGGEDTPNFNESKGEENPYLLAIEGP